MRAAAAAAPQSPAADLHSVLDARPRATIRRSSGSRRCAACARAPTPTSCAAALAATGDRDVHVALFALDQLGACGARRTRSRRSSGRSTICRAPAIAARLASRRARARRAGRRRARARRRGAAAVHRLADLAAAACTRRARRRSSKERDALETLARDEDDNVREAAIDGLRKVAGHDADAIYVAALVAHRSSDSARRGARRSTARRTGRGRAGAEGGVAAAGRRRATTTRTTRATRSPGRCDADLGDAAAASDVDAAQPIAERSQRRGSAPAGGAARARVTIRGVGTFELALFTAQAPATVLRFAHLAEAGLLQRPDLPPRRARTSSSRAAAPARTNTSATPASCATRSGCGRTCAARSASRRAAATPATRRSSSTSSTTRASTTSTRSSRRCSTASRSSTRSSKATSSIASRSSPVLVHGRRVFSIRVSRADLAANRLTAAVRARRGRGDGRSSTSPNRIRRAPGSTIRPICWRRWPIRAALRYAPSPLGALERAARGRRRLRAPGRRRRRRTRIVLTASTSDAYSLLFKLLADAGDEVLVPRPSYPLFEHLTRLDLRGRAALRPRVPRRLVDRLRQRRARDHAAHARACSSSARTTRPARSSPPTSSIGSRRSARRAASRSSPTKCSPTTSSSRRRGARRPRRATRGDVLSFALGGLSKSVGLPQVEARMDRGRRSRCARRPPRSSGSSWCATPICRCRRRCSSRRPSCSSAARRSARKSRARVAANYRALQARGRRGARAAACCRATAAGTRCCRCRRSNRKRISCCDC